MLETEITEYIKSLKGQVAPFQCPSDNCEKTYKTVSKIFHNLKCSLELIRKFSRRLLDSNIT